MEFDDLKQIITRYAEEKEEKALNEISNFAKILRKTYVTLVDEGFSAEEALELIKTLIITGMKNAKE